MCRVNSLASRGPDPSTLSEPELLPRPYISSEPHDGTQTRLTASYPNLPAHQGTGRRTVKDLLRNQARLGQAGKLAKGCVGSINMLRSTLHLVRPFSHQSSFNNILNGLLLNLPWHPAHGEIVAPCWYTLAQRYLFHIRSSTISFSIGDLSR